MKINVVNKSNHKPETNDVYIGRGSPLGNPFPMNKVDNRDDVCIKYEEHLKHLTQPIRNQLNNIVHVAKQQSLSKIR